MDPFAPITPAQENELVALLAAGRGRLTCERLRKQLRGLSTGQAAERLRGLKGEPEPEYIPQPATNPAVTRAAMRARLDAHFAGRQMQQHEMGLCQSSLYAGFNGNPHGMTR